MKLLLNLFLATVLTVFFFTGCSKSEKDILEEVSGVWKISSETTLMEIKLTSDKNLIKMGNLEIPVKVKSVDTENSTINLSMIDKDEIEQVWTFKQQWTEDEKSFTLLWTAHDGTQFNLEYVRDL
ncbi:MAG: hypothetical protein V1779_08865 [bacterium]